MQPVRCRDPPARQTCPTTPAVALRVGSDSVRTRAMCVRRSGPASMHHPRHRVTPMAGRRAAVPRKATAGGVGCTYRPLLNLAVPCRIPRARRWDQPSYSSVG